jgi:hypothetical protein
MHMGEGGRGEKVVLDELFERLYYLTLIGMSSCDPASNAVAAGFINYPILQDIKMFRIYNYHRPGHLSDKNHKTGTGIVRGKDIGDNKRLEDTKEQQGA